MMLLRVPRFVAVHGEDHLPAIGMTPFLMTTLLTG